MGPHNFSRGPSDEEGMQGLASRARGVFAAKLASGCASCGARVVPRVAFCPECNATVQRIRAVNLRWTVAFVYSGAVARAIGRLKSERRTEIAHPLGDLLSQALAPRAEELGSLVAVPVPLHPLRLAERGFNQSALVAGRLARRLGTPLWPSALARTRDTVPQATLRREARRANVVDAFVAREPEHVCGRGVLLVDDVWTTGATLEACEKALLAAGATHVRWAVVARAGY
jgi:ComF family protein